MRTEMANALTKEFPYHKLIEEMGELHQILGKLLEFNDGNHPDGKGWLFDRLADEMGDVLAALDFVSVTKMLDFTLPIHQRRNEKFIRFMDWYKNGSGL